MSKTQEEIRDLMLQGGVDVILGTHSHLVGPLEMTTAQGETMLTAYSLGNLLSTREESEDSQGLVLKLEFTKREIKPSSLTITTTQSIWLEMEEQGLEHLRF